MKKNITNCLYNVEVPYLFENKKIFQLLSKYKVNYLVQPGMFVQNFILNIKFIDYLKYKFRQIRKGKFFHFKKIIVRKFFVYFKSDFWGIKKARYAYLIGKYAYINKKKHKLIGDKTGVIWVHSRNYDEHLRTKVSKIKTKRKKALFIDQGVPFHPDQIEIGLSNIEPKEYYNSIRNFLEKINKNFGYKIEVSCHPKFELKKLKNFFPKFTVKFGDTINQIRNSNLIITHDSTAMNFAVMYKKPLIFITTNTLNNSGFPFYETINTKAKLLNKKCINIDNDSIVDIKNNLKINEKSYSKYFTNYIKLKGPKKLQADIIYERLKGDKVWV